MAEIKRPQLLGALMLAGVVLAAIYLAPTMAGKIAYTITAGQNAADREHLDLIADDSDTLSPLFRQVAKVVKPAVVEVRVVQWIEVQGNAPGTGRLQQMRGLGSGVIIDADNGLIVTNDHVIAGADKIMVILSDRRTYEVQWVKTDPDTDLAIIKIDAPHLLAAPLGDSDKAQVGDWVMAIGAPRGLPQTVTAGIISAKGRSTHMLARTLYQDYLQTDAAINHGNSGGPLVNMHGQVIGINAAIISPNGAFEGTGLAIPVNMLKQMMPQLLDKGSVKRGFVGIEFQDEPLSEQMIEALGVPDHQGALVAALAPAGPAEKAGLQARDFIVSLDGRKVGDVNAFRNLIAMISPGSEVTVEIYRDRKKIPLKVAVIERPKDPTSAFVPHHSPRGWGRYGIRVTELTPEAIVRLNHSPDLAGVLVAGVASGSEAASRGLTKDTVILQVNSKKVATPEEFALALADKGADKGVWLQILLPTGDTKLVFLERH